MYTSRYIQIGQLLKPHGIKGELKFKFDPQFTEKIQGATLLYLDEHDPPVPYFIKELRITSEGKGVVLFDDVTDPQLAKRISSLKILHEFDAKEEIPIPQDLSQLIGYIINDETHGELGVIEDVLELPSHFVAIINLDNREVLVPLNEETIRSIDHTKRSISLSLPKGLLDIY